MATADLVTESRAVSDFDRVDLRDYGELAIIEGEQESLSIETHPDMLRKIETEVRDGRLIIRVGGSWWDKVSHALSTSLTMQPIKYTLTVKELTGLEIFGAGRVTASSLETERLALRLSGAGDVNIESLTAELLEVDVPGAGKIDLRGQVAEQRITMRGAGSYTAPKLKSKKASVSLSGAGKATLWVVEDLNVSISGLGNVEYYGSPTVRQSVSGLGSVTGLGNP